MTYRFCLGCIYGMSEYGRMCFFNHWWKRDRCPCGNCLVKSMCSSECTKRNDAIELIIREHHLETEMIQK